MHATRFKPWKKTHATPLQKDNNITIPGNETSGWGGGRRPTYSGRSGGGLQLAPLTSGGIWGGR